MASVETQDSTMKTSQLQDITVTPDLDTSVDEINISNKDSSIAKNDVVDKKDLIVNKNKTVDTEKTSDCNIQQDVDSARKKDEMLDGIMTEQESQQNDLSTEKKERENVQSLNTTTSVAENHSKLPKDEDVKDSPSKARNNLKRKRRSLITQEPDLHLEESNTRSKRKKVKNASDRFCWRCHKESADAHCTACPRSWHRRCIGGIQPTSLQNWICGECATILKAENAETRSAAMAQLSVDQLCLLLCHVVERMREYPGSEPFWKPVELSEVPNYLDYVVKPMDLNLLESNVRAKLYGSTDAFMADAKWVQHNCIVFNTCGGVYADTSKLTNAAKQIIKLARQEVSEIEACPDCYAHGRNLPRPQPSWFIEPCRRPHPLVWAKLKGFPFWPAKAMPRVNSQGFVDVRFFGEHDRAWVSPRDLYLYSQDPPAPLPRKRKLDMDECVREITRHCRKLELVFGQFKFAPPKVQYNPNDPMQIKLMLPNYDPLHPNNCIPSQFLAPKKKSLPKKRISLTKSKSRNDLQKADISDVNSKTSFDSDVSMDTSMDADDSRSENKSPKTERLDTSEEAKSTSAVSLNTEDFTDESQKNEIKTKCKDVKTHSNKFKSNNETFKPHTRKEQDNLEKPVDKEKTINKLTEGSHIENLAENEATIKKESVLKNNTVKTDDVSNSTVSQKTIKPLKSIPKVYKPKTRMVDKVNAERALKSISNNEQNQKLNTDGISNKLAPIQTETTDSKDTIKVSDTTTTTFTMMTSKSQAQSSDISVSKIPTPTKNSTDQSLALFLVVNSGTADNVKQTSLACEKEKTESAVHIQPKEMSSMSPVKKESKAKKSFPNKPRNHQQNISQSSNTSSNTIDPMAYVPAHQIENGYQLIPPEAGPVSARLYHGAHDLAKRMAQLMQEAYKETAQESYNCENGSSESHQATVHFLRLQIERMRWQHQQQLAELKHNTDRILREMRASLEAERLRAIEETRREAEQEKARCIEEIKRKQWCAMCGREAMFYCCWNTAYCDYPCQQSHWPAHMRTCAQQPSFATIVTPAANTSQQQVMPRLMINTQHGTSNYGGPRMHFGVSP